MVTALVSAASFALSGSFASSLFTAGWSPGAAVTIRIISASLLLLVPALRAVRGRWELVRNGAGSIVVFGLLAVAGAQLCYFNAVQTLSVGVALMVEYMGLVLVVGWQALTACRWPHRTTVVGVILALLGLMLVLDVLGDVAIDAGGILWASGAAVGLATYFVVASNDRTDLPPLAMASFGMFVGAVVLVALGVVGILPMHASTRSVELAGARLPWFVAVLGLGLVTGAVAYWTGIVAARRLGAKLAAFLGLTEVMFAVLFAWFLLGELPELIQLLGGVLILAGIAVVRLEQLGDGVDAPAVVVDNSRANSPR